MYIKKKKKNGGGGPTYKYACIHDACFNRPSTATSVLHSLLYSIQNLQSNNKPILFFVIKYKWEKKLKYIFGSFSSTYCKYRIHYPKTKLSFLRRTRIPLNAPINT